MADSSLVEVDALPITNVSSDVISWEGAAERGLAARKSRELIIKEVLKPKYDFGIIPGTNKPTLLKPGAEKIADSLNLCPMYERLPGTIENFETEMFHYVYRCKLVYRGTEIIVATGVGSCNSHESKYRYRHGANVCPDCGATAIIKGAEQYGGGWLCWKKKDGCGKKWSEADAFKTPERVLNEDICDQVNTIDKMGQKRSLVAAVLNLGFSEQFTQDMEDMPRQEAATTTKSAVKQPKEKTKVKAKAKTKVADDQPAPAQSGAEESQVDSGMTFTGFIDNVSKRTGETNDEAWTLYTIHSPKGDKFSTFEEEVADNAAMHCEAGVEVVIEFKKTKKGGNNITALYESSASN